MIQPTPWNTTDSTSSATASRHIENSNVNGSLLQMTLHDESSDLISSQPESKGDYATVLIIPNGASSMQENLQIVHETTNYTSAEDDCESPIPSATTYDDALPSLGTDVSTTTNSQTSIQSTVLAEIEASQLTNNNDKVTGADDKTEINPNTISVIKVAGKGQIFNSNFDEKEVQNCREMTDDCTSSDCMDGIESSHDMSSSEKSDKMLQSLAPPPVLSRHDPIHRTSTPGAYRLSCGNSAIPVVGTENDRNLSSIDYNGNVSVASNSHNHDDDNSNNEESTIANREQFAPDRNLLLESRQWSFRSTPLEARLVTSHGDHWMNHEYPPPPGFPVATISSEIVIAEAFEFSQKDTVVSSADSSCYRRMLFVAVGFSVACIVGLLIYLGTKLHETPGVDGTVDSFHVVVFGEDSTCSNTLQLSCGGMNVIDDDRSEITVFYSNSSYCEKLGTNSAICRLNNNTRDANKLIHGGVWFHCRRRYLYVDGNDIVSSAIFRNTNEGCMSKLRTRDDGLLDEDSGNGFQKYEFGNGIHNENRTIDLENAVVARSVSRYVGLGHFCQVKSEGDMDSSWSLLRNSVVLDGIKYEGCRTPNASFTDSNDTQLSYCSLPRMQPLTCWGNGTECSRASTRRTTATELGEIAEIDTFTKCQDYREMNESEKLIFKNILNDAISESWSLYS